MTNPAPEVVLYEKRGGVAHVVLNRPHVRNAYNVAMRDRLFEVLTAIRDDPEVGAVVLFGNGPSFGSGGDLREFGSAESPVSARQVRWLRDVWGTLWDLPQITIAGAHGSVAGGGFEMLMLCDLVYAAKGTSFALPETGLGMIPGVAGTQTLPRLVGCGRALELTLTGVPLEVRAAANLGLVQGVWPEPHLRARVTRIAEKCAALDTGLRVAVKRLVRWREDPDGLSLPAGAGVWAAEAK